MKGDLLEVQVVVVFLGQEVGAHAPGSVFGARTVNRSTPDAARSTLWLSPISGSSPGQALAG
jgi:hypothetical protein